jgi:hypothetical protein
MTEPSAVNSHESKHRLANVKLTEQKYAKHLFLAIHPHCPDIY